MPSDPFYYQPPQNPFVSSITALLLRPGEIEAAKAQQIAQAQAGAVQQAGAARAGAQQFGGQALGQAIGQAGQQIGGAIEQVNSPQAQMARMQLDAAKQSQQQRGILSSAYLEALGPDGRPDRDKLRTNLIAKGFGPATDEILKGYDEAEAANLKVQEARTSLENAEKAYERELATKAEAANFDPVVIDGLLTHAEQNKHDVTFYRQLEQQPEQLKAYVTRLLHPPDLRPVAAGSNVYDFSRPGSEPVFTAPTATPDYTVGNTRFSGKTNQPIASVERPPTETDLAIKAAQGDPEAQKALDVLRATENEQLRIARSNLAARWQEVLARPSVTPNEALSATMRLRSDFRTETSAAQEVTRQYELMKSALESVKAGRQASGSQGVLVTFQKILDPTSVVRESEYARSAAGQSYLNQLQGTMDRIAQGGAGVPVTELENFVKTAEQFAKKQRDYANVAKTQIEGIARRYNLAPEDITRDLEMPSASTGGSVVKRVIQNGVTYDVTYDAQGKVVSSTKVGP